MGSVPQVPLPAHSHLGNEQIEELGQLRQENLALRTALAFVEGKFAVLGGVFSRLAAETRQFFQENHRLRVEKKRLLDRVQVLEEQLLEAQRASKRQAAPFRRNKRIPKAEQKKPGREKGHKPDYRQPPTEVDETVQVPVACNCPECGAGLEDFEEHEHFTVDCPPIKPKTTRYVSWSGKCPRCKKRHHSKHPDLPSNATGAAGTTLGHNAVALAGLLRTHLGAPLRKIAHFFALVLGISISPAGVLGILERLSKAGKATCQGLMMALRTCNAVHVDETGWRLCSKSAWLWVFANRQATIYVIRYSRGHKVVLEVLGTDFSGWLITDCLATYDSLPYPNKGKCVGHFLKALSDLEALHSHTGRAIRPKWPGRVIRKCCQSTDGAPRSLAVSPIPRLRELICESWGRSSRSSWSVYASSTDEENRRFPRRAKEILTMAVNLKNSQPQLSGEIYEATRCVVLHLVDDLLKEEITEPNNLRLAKRMRKHRQAMLAFLDHQEVDATNNLGERQIRPAVLQRKISAGKLTPRQRAAPPSVHTGGRHIVSETLCS